MNETKPPLEWRNFEFHWLKHGEKLIPARWTTEQKWQITGGTLTLSPFEVANEGACWYSAAVPPMWETPVTALAFHKPTCKHTWTYDPNKDDLVCPNCKVRRDVLAPITERPKA